MLEVKYDVSIQKSFFSWIFLYTIDYLKKELFVIGTLLINMLVVGGSLMNNMLVVGHSQ